MVDPHVGDVEWSLLEREASDVTILLEAFVEVVSGAEGYQVWTPILNP